MTWWKKQFVETISMKISTKELCWGLTWYLYSLNVCVILRLIETHTNAKESDLVVHASLVVAYVSFGKNEYICAVLFCCQPSYYFWLWSMNSSCNLWPHYGVSIHILLNVSTFNTESTVLSYIHKCLDIIKILNCYLISE